MISSKKILFISLAVLLVVSLALNVYLLVLFKKDAQNLQALRYNSKVLSFINMFTEKVLLADSEVDFDSRMALETLVRELNDREIFDEWKAFTNSANQEVASIEAKKLLRLLVRKTSY